MRHLLAVHIFNRCADTRGTEGQERHFVAFDELPGLLDALRRAVGIVTGDEVDLSAPPRSLMEMT
jgi:hypothetical protein